MSGKPWTTTELAELARLYPKTTAAVLAVRLGRSAGAIHQAAILHGLSKQDRATVDGTFLEKLLALNADGLSDTEAADHLGCERSTATKWRRRLGLPCHARGERYRARVREKTREQLEAAGFLSLAMVRVGAFRDFAARRGWPVDLPPRAVMILDALSANGMMTRRQIADAIGMGWHGSRGNLKSNSTRGSYLAELIARGLVIDLGRIVKGQGKGRSVHLYSLALTATPEEERSR